MNPVELLFGWNSWPIWNWELQVWGCRLTACSFDRLLNLYLHRFQLMGAEDRQHLVSLIKPGMTVVDVGANQGLYTLLLAKLVGTAGRVLAFEPDPVLFHAMQNNCRRNGARNVELFNIALGARKADMALCHSRVNAGDNRLAKSAHMDWFREVPVKMSSFDDLARPAPVDFIKVDVQGWELEVLKGMDAVLRANLGLHIYFEFWQYGLRRAGTDPLDLFDYLQTRSFQVHEYLEKRWRPIGDPAGFCQRTNQHGYLNLLAARSGVF